MRENAGRADATDGTERDAPAVSLREALRLLSAFAEGGHADASSIAESAAAAVREALSLDVACMRIARPPVTVVATPRGLLPAEKLPAIREALESALDDAASPATCRIPAVAGDTDLRVARRELGAHGLLAAASRRRSFPTPLERDVLAIAARLFAAELERHATARSQRRQEAQREVAEVFASARTTAEATSGILRALCEHLAWRAGAIWVPDGAAGVLRCAGFRTAPGLAVPDFEAESRHRTFAQGIGLPGRVWASGRPEWIPDVTQDANFPRAPVAGRDGLHAAVGFPIRLGEEILGVIEFFSDRIQAPDEELLAMMATVGLHLGQFLDRSRANEMRAETEQRFARFMHHLPGLAWLKDRNGRYVYANDKAVEVFRTPRAELYGRTDDEIFAPDTAALFRENDREALQSPTGVQVIETLKHADGLVHHSLATKFPIAGADGAPALVGGFALDITDHLRTAEALRESEERLALAVQEAGMATWDEDVLSGGAVWSETHFRILGYEPVPGGAASHELFVARIHPEDRERVTAGLEQARRAQTPYRLEYRIVRADTGEIRWLSAFGRFRGPEGARFVGVLFDNTERRRAEEALKDADRRKDEFLALLAHELRNPLGPIRNASHLLRVGAGAPGDIERIHLMLERQVQHMVRLVDDLLDVSRISRGRLQLQKARVDLKGVVSSAVEAARPLAEAAFHRLTLHLAPGPVIAHADAVRVTQVLSNLLHNAAKYTPAGGNVGVTLEAEGEWAVIRVHDTGVGIPAALLPRIFDMFSQGEGPAGRSGLGIGLTIAKNLVELHGGTIDATSRGEGQGAEFVVRLPRSASTRSAEQETTPPGEASMLNGCRVMLVEDNQDARDSLALILERQGAEVRVAGDGMAALHAIATAPPDVVVVDIAMPGMDGFEVARRIRARPELNGVSLIALTGFGRETDRALCREVGFDHHVVKPADPSALTALIRSIAWSPARRP